MALSIRDGQKQLAIEIGHFEAKELRAQVARLVLHSSKGHRSTLFNLGLGFERVH